MVPQTAPVLDLGHACSKARRGRERGTETETYTETETDTGLLITAPQAVFPRKKHAFVWFPPGK